MMSVAAMEQSAVEQLTRMLELRVPFQTGSKSGPDVSEVARESVGRALASAEPAAAVVNESLREASLPAVLGPWDPSISAPAAGAAKRGGGWDAERGAEGGSPDGALVARLLARIAELERQNSELLERSVGYPSPSPPSASVSVKRVVRPQQQGSFHRSMVPAHSRAHFSGDTEGEEDNIYDDDGDVTLHDEDDNVATLDSSFHSALRELRALALQRQEYEAEIRPPELGGGASGAPRDALLGQLSTSIERWETNLQQAFGGFSCTEVPLGEGGSDADGASEDGRKRNSTVRVSFDSVASSSSLRSQPRQPHSHLFAPHSSSSSYHPHTTGAAHSNRSPASKKRELDLSNFDFHRLWAK